MEEDFTALLSGAVAYPVHWRRQPVLQDSFPYINLTMVAAPVQYTVEGESGLQEALIQVDVWAETYSEMVTAERLVSAALSGFQALQGGTDFDLIEKGTSRDLGADLTLDDARSNIFGRSADYRVVHS